jgi:hypothetical protein
VVQRAWSQIKATAEEQRVLWLEVGVALMYGKIKENRANGQKFSEWVQEKFEGLGRTDSADAIWFAENLPMIGKTEEGLTHPTSIRRAHSEQQALLENADPVLKEGPAPVGVAEKFTKNASGYHEQWLQQLPPWPSLGFSK